MRYDTVRSDSEEQVEEMVVTARDYGADFVLVGGLTLFGKGPLKTARRLWLLKRSDSCPD
ncbi:MAG: hypothetical protein KAX25_04795 [Dehalococcoidia bacterium]|nr:hypothetical protein [Dehalococcoidia bacterium]